MKPTTAHRLGLSLTLLFTLMLVWMAAGVGLLGPDGGRDERMYLAIVLVAAVGATASRLRPRGMAGTVAAMIVGLGVIVAIALANGAQHRPGSSVLEIVGVNGMYAVLYGGCLLLFRRAGARGVTSAAAPAP